MSAEPSNEPDRMEGFLKTSAVMGAVSTAAILEMAGGADPKEPCFRFAAGCFAIAIVINACLYIYIYLFGRYKPNDMISLYGIATALIVGVSATALGVGAIIYYFSQWGAMVFAVLISIGSFLLRLMTKTTK
jgi:hypothetical protein